MTRLLRWAMLGLALGASAALAQTARISISTGGTGGVYYPLGGGMANILSKYVPGLQATAEVTGGSVDNLKLLGAGKAEVGFSMVDAAEKSLAPNRFVSEVEEFRATIANPSLSLVEKKRAYGLIVRHAALLDPEDAGFWRAGVALKVALCAWLDFQPILEH